MGDVIGVEKRIQIFSDTQERMKSDAKLRKLTELAVKSSRLYSEDFDVVIKNTSQKAEVSVVNERALITARRLKDKYDKVAVLNFACATNPGGGVVTGSEGQEESLCLCTNLYSCLYQEEFWESFYGFYKSLGSPYHGDKIIFTPNITVFKRETEFPEYMEDWFNIDVITSAAPDLGWVKSYKDQVVYNVLKNRITAILKVAIDNGEEALVLGAFGCGKFCDPPEIVAKAFKDTLEEGFINSFKEIVFAVYGTSGKDIENYKIFNNIIGCNS